MSYFDKLKSKFEKLSTSRHDKSGHSSGGCESSGSSMYAGAGQGMPSPYPGHWQQQQPGQGYPSGSAGPGGFYAPPPGSQPYGYAPFAGQGYPPSSQPPYPTANQPPYPPSSQPFYPSAQQGPYPPGPPGAAPYPPAEQQGSGPAATPPKPPQTNTEAPSDAPPCKPPRSNPDAQPTQPPGDATARDNQPQPVGLGGSVSGLTSAGLPPGVPLPLDQPIAQSAGAASSEKHAGSASASSMLFLNVQENEMVHQRFLIVYGQLPGITGSDDRVVVRHPYFPPLSFPAVDGYFKVLAELENGDNGLRFEYLQGDKCVGTGTLTIKMTPYMDKPPLLLGVIVGKDSHGEFDAPPNARGPGRNDLDAAIRKLRCCAYMWQAFVAEQLYREGFGRRTFRLEESYEPDTMARDNIQRMTAKVHVLKSRRTVAEIRDKERAQQWKPPPGYERHTEESQFALANEALDDYGQFKGKHFITCLTLDAKWDPELQVILGHAALGGGSGDRRLGVFGSHTTHAWPANAEEIAEKFLDTTKTDTQYLANDAGECGEYWRAANIGMGAFLHECGHLLTLAHTPSGIMSRGFNDYNRTFMARSPNFKGPVKQRDEAGAHWHRTDIIRLRHHLLLRLPGDPPLRENEQNETGFEVMAIEEGILVCSLSGITMIEVWINGRYRNHVEFTSENLQRRRNGSLPADQGEMATDFPQQVFVDENKLHHWAGKWSNSDKVDLVLTSRAMATGTFENIMDMAKKQTREDRDGNRVFSAAKLGNGEMKGSVASEVLFSAKSIRSSAPKLRSIEIRSGNYIDGVIFHMDDGSQAQIGKCAGGGRSVMQIDPDDDLDHIVVKSGWWIDGLEFVTTRGQRSGWKGGRGGGDHILKPPMGYGFMGLSGSGAGWLDSLTMHYARCK
ncbi:hypothetical protein H4S02_000705 [Coemansia sp. RSA 2611]|nr:hypothetical protein IWW52_000736 [Coemansia sp. RSA 2704]KAJ2368491.1 hypothetical protein H4S01_001561 [Coemansia sp. RSA 2610]KAJ2392582.1 hypothetical protein H4S02_000705 [Coemansia sp. RSA 2611]